MKILFLDESGDHSLRKIDSQYPVFVLGGVIVDGVTARRSIDEELRKLKSTYFGSEDLILHTSDIVRTRNGFEALKDPRVRESFYKDLNRLMRELDYRVVACVIHKDQHLARYGEKAIDPYMLSLRVLVERFCHEIGDAHDGGFIYAEKRSPELDLALETAWVDILRNGTAFKRRREIAKRIVDLGTRDKRLNVSGLQLADLVVSPIGRAVLGMQTHEDWEIVKEKFRMGPSGFEGYGLIVLPRPE